MCHGPYTYCLWACPPTCQCIADRMTLANGWSPMHHSQTHHHACTDCRCIIARVPFASTSSSAHLWTRHCLHNTHQCFITHASSIHHSLILHWQTNTRQHVISSAPLIGASLAVLCLLPACCLSRQGKVSLILGFLLVKKMKKTRIERS